MSQQIPVSSGASAIDPLLDASRDDHTHEIAPGLAYRRLAIVNVAFVGSPGAGDRKWTLVDAGLMGSAAFIRSAAAARFGARARPAAIVLTHGHFDHVGVLEELAEEWDAPVFAHELEHPYLDGSASYPPGDASVGGGLMATLSPLFPTKPVDVSKRLHRLDRGSCAPGMEDWEWVHTPGHSVGHASFWRAADRVLIAGDAFVTTAQESVYGALTQEPELHGPPMYYTVDWAAAKASVERLAALDPKIVVTGHGQAIEGPELRAGLQRLARDFATVATPRQGRYLDAPARAEDGTAYHRP